MHNGILDMEQIFNDKLGAWIYYLISQTVYSYNKHDKRAFVDINLQNNSKSF